MQPSYSRSIPLWVARSVQQAFRGLCVRQGQILESPRSARWDIVVELENGSEVMAWVEKPDQNPATVQAILRQALHDAGIVV